MRITTPALTLAALLAALPSYSLLHARRSDVQPAPTASLRVVTDPSAATIYVDKHNMGTSPLDLPNLSPGKHLVEIHKKGYQTWRQTADLDQTKRNIVEAKLTRNQGLLLIRTTPEGASIRINGIDRGRGPLLVTDLDTGDYRIGVASAGYIGKEVRVKLPDRRPRMVDVSLLSDFGKLVIDSVPTGAAVTLNGIDKGTTPVTLDRIPTGTSTLELAAEGYKRHSETLRLTAGETQQLSFPLEAIPASMRVVSIPLKARVYVNNQFEGNAPVFLSDLVPGQYRVRVELPDHDPAARTVTLKRAERVVEEFRLKANVGAVKLTTEPAGVEVLIDGDYEQITTATPNKTDNVSEVLTLDAVPSGTRKFRFVHKDYFTREQDVTVIRDDTTTLHVKLERRFIPNLEVRTHAGVHKGVYQGLGINGEIKLEVRPGITKTFAASEVLSSRPIKQLTPETRETP